MTVRITGTDLGSGASYPLDGVEATGAAEGAKPVQGAKTVSGTDKTGENDYQTFKAGEGDDSDSKERVDDTLINQYYDQIEEYTNKIEALEDQISDLRRNSFSGDFFSNYGQITALRKEKTGYENRIIEILGLISIRSEGIMNGTIKDSPLSIASSVPRVEISGTNTLGYGTEGSSVKGNSVIDMARQYDDKTASEMSKIMKSKGSKYHERAWCGDFVTFILKETYGKDGTPGDIVNKCNTASCPALKAWAIKNNCWETDVSKIQPGDLVIFDWEDDGKANHVGFFIRQNPDGTIQTIEGNTYGKAGKSCVEEKPRKKQTILGFIALSKLK